MALIKRNMPDRICESQADYEFEQEQETGQGRVRGFVSTDYEMPLIQA